MNYENTDYPVCPNCWEQCTDILGLAFSFNLHEMIEMDCPNCGETFKVRTHISVSYSTEK